MINVQRGNSMDVFFTSFTEGSIGDKASAIYYPTDQTLKEELCDKNYGSGLSQWFLMFVINSSRMQGYDAPERVMYKKKSKELDMRLKIDFESFKQGDEAVRRKLLYSCMLRSLDLMAQKNIPNFDALALEMAEQIEV